MHFVVNYVAGISKVDRIDDFVVTVFFISIQIFGLATMTWRQ